RSSGTTAAWCTWPRRTTPRSWSGRGRPPSTCRSRSRCAGPGTGTWRLRWCRSWGRAPDGLRAHRHLVGRDPGAGRGRYGPWRLEGAAVEPVPGGHRPRGLPGGPDRQRRLHGRMAQGTAPLWGRPGGRGAGGGRTPGVGVRRRRLDAARPGRRPPGRGERGVTETVVSSATREVVIGFDRPFVMLGERI